jgi:hypothetical protein
VGIATSLPRGPSKSIYWTPQSPYIPRVFISHLEAYILHCLKIS